MISPLRRCFAHSYRHRKRRRIGTFGSAISWPFFVQILSKIVNFVLFSSKTNFLCPSLKMIIIVESSEINRRHSQNPSHRFEQMMVQSRYCEYRTRSWWQNECFTTFSFWTTSNDGPSVLRTFYSSKSRRWHVFNGIYTASFDKTCLLWLFGWSPVMSPQCTRTQTIKIRKTNN